MKTKIWAHRGACEKAAENTLPAFSIAADDCADGIELDIHLSRDGELVVIHDEKVDRTSDGQGWIKDMTLPELKRLDFSNEFQEKAQIPTLKEVYELIKPTGLLVNVEVKTTMVQYEGIELKALQLAEAMGMSGRVMYSSFNHYSLVAIKQINPNAKIGALYQEGLIEPWKYAQNMSADAIHPYYANLFVPSLVEGCHEAGVEINVWTVNSTHDIEFALAKGVDGIITNRPHEARKLRDEE